MHRFNIFPAIILDFFVEGVEISVGNYHCQKGLATYGNRDTIRRLPWNDSNNYSFDLRYLLTHQLAEI